MSGLFASDFFSHLGHRQAMWQMMLGGVFDRHPKLKLMLTEVRADWIPATLQYLDRVFEEHRAELPSSRASRATGGTATASPACRSCTSPKSRSATRSASST